MSKQTQLLPRVPHADSGGLFGTGTLTVHYEEWNRTSKSYRSHYADVEDVEEAAVLMEYLNVCRILEPLIRFLAGQEVYIAKDFGNQFRLQPVGKLKRYLQQLLEPKDQTCQQVAEYFLAIGGEKWKEAMPGKKSKYWERANLLLEEIRTFTRQHRAAKSVAA